MLVVCSSIFGVFRTTAVTGINRKSSIITIGSPRPLKRRGGIQEEQQDSGQRVALKGSAQGKNCTATQGTGLADQANQPVFDASENQNDCF